MTLVEWFHFISARRSNSGLGAVLRESLATELALSQVDAGQKEAAEKISEDFNAMLRGQEASVAGLLSLEKRLLPLLTAPALRRRAWGVRERFARAAGAAGFHSYLASEPPDPGSSEIDIVLADVAALIDAISACYTFSEIRARKLLGLKRQALVVLLLLGLVTTLVGLAVRGDDKVILAPIVLLGALGGAVSFARRVDAIEPRSLYDVDPVLELTTIDGARWAGAIAISLGSIFAMLLYVIFASGMLSGAPFPAFIFDEVTDRKIFLSEFMQTGGLKHPTDVGKVLVWSFIAGFAERLVPDLIDRLSRSASASQPDWKPAPFAK